MLQIRPISDLRNNFTAIEKEVNKGEPVFLTKNGYGTMVVLSLEKYDSITSEEIEKSLDEADFEALHTSKRLTHMEVFNNARKIINAKKN